MRALIVGAIALLAGSGCAREVPHPQTHSDAIQWSAIVPVSTDGGAAPGLALAPDGHVTASWVSAPNAGTDGRLILRPNLSLAEGSAFRDAAGSLSIYGEVPPKIAYGPDGTLYAAYLVTRAIPGHQWPVNTLRFVASTDNGKHWGTPSTIQSESDNGGSTDDHALYVARDGTILAMWLAMHGHVSHTYIAHSTDHGTTWSAPVVVDHGASCPCCRTALAVSPDGAVYAAWRKIYPGGTGQGEVRDIALARSHDMGRSWSAPVRVHEDDWHVNYCPDAGPSLLAEARGVVHVAWWTGRSGAAGVRYVRSSDGGSTFGSPIPLGVAQLSQPAHVQLAMDAKHPGDIAAAWDDGTLAVPRITIRVSRDDGVHFETPSMVSAPNERAGYPAVVMHNDTLRLAWQVRTVTQATHDSIAHAASKHQMTSQMASMQWINPVASWQVVTRMGILAPGTQLSATPAVMHTIAVGEQIPSYVVSTLQGAPVHLGGREPVTMLNVWATWCTACRDEMAHLNVLQRDFSAQGVRVIAVSVDNTMAPVQQFVSALHPAFTAAYDKAGDLERLYGVIGLPTTYIIGHDGRVIWRYAGDLRSVESQARDAVQRALRE